MSEPALSEPTIAIISDNPIKILHVDDDLAFLSLSKQLLELQADIKVQSISSIKEALKILKTKKFDVIISDYQMNDKNGLDFLREIKALGIITPFILFTGKGRDEIAVKALNLGAFRYMNKRGTPDAVYAELASCVRQAKDYAATQEMLKENEKRFKAIFDSSIDAILVLNDSGDIIYCNKAATFLLNYARKQITKALSSHFNKQFTATYEKYMDNGFDKLSDGNLTMSGKTVDLILKKTSKKPIFVELSFSAFTEKGIWYGVSIVRNVTERKLQDQLLEKSEQTLKALFSSNPEAIVFTDKNYRITKINHSFTELFGCKIEDVKGKDISTVVVPKEFEEESKMIRQLLAKGPISMCTKRKKGDGTIFDVALSGGSLIVKSKIIGYFFVYMDITDVMSVQKELNNALDHANLLNEKIRVLGGFTRHDVRNKLGLIQGNLYLARKKCVITPDLERYLQNIDDSIKNTVNILDFAKTYETIGEQSLVSVNVGQMIQNAVSLFSDLKGIKIQNQCMHIDVVADSMLTEVFHNLIDNSLKYGEKLTTISIHTEKLDNQTLKLVYKDDGVGVDRHYKQYLFQKGAGKGTGLGLFLIRKICDVYGWSVDETGVPGKGVQFEFFIPMNHY